jgi:hypothetical protein
MMKRFFFCLNIFILLLFVGLQASFGEEKAFGKIAYGQKIELTEQEKAWLAKNHTVRVRVNDYPPFVLEAGGIRGISVDYLESIFALHNIKYEYVGDVKWLEVLEALKNNKKIDLVMTVVQTSEREYYATLPGIIYSHQESFLRGMTRILLQIFMVCETRLFRLKTDMSASLCLKRIFLTSSYGL